MKILEKTINYPILVFILMINDFTNMITQITEIQTISYDWWGFGKTKPKWCLQTL